MQQKTAATGILSPDMKRVESFEADEEDDEEDDKEDDEEDGEEDSEEENEERDIMIKIDVHQVFLCCV